MNKENNASAISAWLRDQTKDEVFTLTDSEYYAVYDYIDGRKDSFPDPLKEGLLKLLNGEMHRRM